MTVELGQVFFQDHHSMRSSHFHANFLQKSHAHLLYLLTYEAYKYRSENVIEIKHIMNTLFAYFLEYFNLGFA